jgi:pimeloyl-ACP methyl ester carboxylesterase
VVQLPGIDPLAKSFSLSESRLKDAKKLAGEAHLNFNTTRREAMIGTAAALAAAGASTVSGQPARRTFVLVHGAWHGGWCWRRVSDLLEQKGNKVFSPTMTGLGERAHLLTRDVNLTTHITDIVNVMEWENLSDVVLVAHSYGGIIASGVAERVHDRISSIVFLDAFMPENGETLLEKSSPAFVDAIKSAIEKGDAGIKAPPAAAFGVEEKDRMWVDSKTTPHPVGTYTEKAVYTDGRDKISTKTFIRAKGYKSAAFDANLAKVKAAGWKTHELEVGHDAMVIIPEQLTGILLST